MSAVRVCMCVPVWLLLDSSSGRQEWERVGGESSLKRIPAMLGISALGVLMECCKKKKSAFTGSKQLFQSQKRK